MYVLLSNTLRYRGEFEWPEIVLVLCEIEHESLKVVSLIVLLGQTSSIVDTVCVSFSFNLK